MTVDAPDRAARLAASILGSIPPRPSVAAGAAGHGLQPRVAGAAFAHERCVGMAPRIGGVQARLVGEQHEHVGLDQVRDQRAQRVVVADADFIRGDGVVFVDDRDHGEFDQRAQRRPRVQVTPAVGTVLVRQQHLRRVQAVLHEGGFVRLHETHLADGGRCLQFVDGLRARGPAQSRDAFGDRAGGNQHDLAATAFEQRDFLGPSRDRRVVESPPVVGDQARADLDDETPAVPELETHSSAAGVRRRRALTGSGDTTTGVVS